MKSKGYIGIKICASYLKRYEFLCQRLVKERLYTKAVLLTSQRNAAETGIFDEMSEMISFRGFITGWAGHAAAEAARPG